MGTIKPYVAALALALGWPDVGSAQNCTNWMTPDFWASAGPLEVSDCLSIGYRAIDRDENGTTAMHLAAAGGFVGAINALSLSSDGLVYEQDNLGLTPLHYAVRHNPDPEILRALIALGADAGGLTDAGESVLDHAAAYAHNPLVLRLLIAAGAEVAPDYETLSHKPETPVMFAARYNSNPEILLLLLESGADIHAVDMREHTLVHMAVQSGNDPAIIAELLALGLDVNAPQFDGSTPLHLAMENGGNLAMVEALIAEGADVNLGDNRGIAPLAYGATQKVPPVILEKLVAAGADIYAADEMATTAMHAAAAQKGNLAVIRALVALGGDINDMEADLLTPLHIAAGIGDADTVLGMLDLGADPSLPTRGGRFAYGFALNNTALAGTGALARLKAAAVPPPPYPEACRYWPSADFWLDVSPALVRQCLPYENVNSHAHYGETPLLLAISLSHNDIAVARMLLGAGAEANLADDADFTSLHAASALGKVEIVRLLLAAGADATSADVEWRTPLHMVKGQEAAQIAAMLIAAGADPLALDDQGRPAWEGALPN